MVGNPRQSIIGEMKTFIYLFNLLPLIFLVKGSVVTSRQGAKVVMCNLNGMSSVRPEAEFRVDPEDVDVSICTHLVYSSALVGQRMEVEPRMRFADMEEDGGLGLYNRTLALKNTKPDLKVLIDVLDHQGFLGEQIMSGNLSAVVNFSKNAADFVQKHGFDGMQFIARRPEAFQEVAPILHEEFARRELPMVTVTMPTEERGVGPRFEMTEALSRNFDFIVIGSYWKIPAEETTIVSSMLNLESVVTEYRAKGIPPGKLVVPIPAFSVTVKLCRGTETGIGSRACDDDDDIMNPQGTKLFLYNWEMRKKMADSSEGWVVVRDEASKVPYAHSNSLLWTSFEDPESVRAKAEFILENDLAGASIMNSYMEDYKGQYTEGGERFPITRAVFNALNRQT